MGARWAQLSSDTSLLSEGRSDSMTHLEETVPKLLFQSNGLPSKTEDIRKGQHDARHQTLLPGEGEV